MGMARAIGMQRGQLIRMFVMEGAVYSFGAAVVGAIAGMLVGWGLVEAVASAFSQSSETEDFRLAFHVTLRSVLVAFFIGIIVTFVTVAIASWRISKLNIVRAIRDVPDPKLVKEGRRTLIWGIVFILLGLFIALNGWNAKNIAGFRVGLSIVPFGIANVLRYRGVSSRAVWSAVGIVLMVYWLLPTKMITFGRDDWNVDISIFFISGGMVVTGAVMALMNNADFILGAVMRSLGQVRRMAPIVKSAVSYPLRSAFRTGLSVAMFAIVVFSIVVMSTLTFSFERLFKDTERIAGGYDVIALAQTDVNPLADVNGAIAANPDLSFITRRDGQPSVGTVRTILRARAKLAERKEFKTALVVGVDRNFVDSNSFGIKLATTEFRDSDAFDAPALWNALAMRPGTAVVNAFLLPRRANFGEPFTQEAFRLDPEGLFLENDVMDPVKITVEDVKSGKTAELTVIGVVDDLASQFFMPFGIYASTETLQKAFERDIPLTNLFIHVNPGTSDAAPRVEAAFFQNAMDTIDIAERIDETRAQQVTFNNLLTGFMALGLVVGVAALGVISARAVVERRKQIGVMRAIGFSRRMVQTTFLLESSFIALLGISVGLVLGLITSVNVITDIREDEPNVSLVIPWMRLVVIVVGSYLFSWVTTYLPARQAARVDPADALRFE
jgi:putative ABC transport system permease protein